MEPLPSEVSSPLQPLQALGEAVSASLACAEEMVPQKLLLHRSTHAVSARCLLSTGENAGVVCVVVFGMDHLGQGFGDFCFFEVSKAFSNSCLITVCWFVACPRGSA